MQERIRQDKSSNHYQGLRVHLIKLREENERLKRESSKLPKRMDKDKSVITYLRKVTPSTRRIQTGRATCLETPLPETPGGVEKITWKAFRKGKE
jgi:regulator of replication initiation timing